MKPKPELKERRMISGSKQMRITFLFGDIPDCGRQERGERKKYTQSHNRYIDIETQI